MPRDSKSDQLKGRSSSLAPRGPKYRLGDLINDYCVRCKRIMNHSLISLINGEPAKVRCRTCHSDHDFRHEQAPPKAGVKKQVLFDQALKKMNPDDPEPSEPERKVASLINSYSDELLVRYHLGELSPEERDAVEDRYFADDLFHEQVLAAEEDLIDSYVRGELSTEQNKHFENWFLQTDERREKLEFAKVLARHITAQAESPASQQANTYLRPTKAPDLDSLQTGILQFSEVSDVLGDDLHAGTGAWEKPLPTKDPPAQGETKPTGESLRPTALRRPVAAFLKREPLSATDRELVKRILALENKDKLCEEFRVDRDYLRVLLHRARLALKAAVLEMKDPADRAN